MVSIAPSDFGMQSLFSSIIYTPEGLEWGLDVGLTTADFSPAWVKSWSAMWIHSSCKEMWNTDSAFTKDKGRKHFDFQHFQFFCCWLFVWGCLGFFFTAGAGWTLNSSTSNPHLKSILSSIGDEWSPEQPLHCSANPGALHPNSRGNTMIYSGCSALRGLAPPLGAGHCQCLPDQSTVENQAKQRLYQCRQYYFYFSFLTGKRKPTMLQHRRGCSRSLVAVKYRCSSLLQETLMRRKPTIMMVE